MNNAHKKWSHAGVRYCTWCLLAALKSAYLFNDQLEFINAGWKSLAVGWFEQNKTKTPKPKSANMNTPSGLTDGSRIFIFLTFFNIVR